MNAQPMSAPWNFATHSPVGASHQHERDSDCTLDPAVDVCIYCHVSHGDPCPECSGRGYHVAGCAMSDEASDCAHVSELSPDGNGAFCRYCGETVE